MNINHYIGFDVHKKSISYCVKAADGKIIEEGKLRATRRVFRVAMAHASCSPCTIINRCQMRKPPASAAPC